MKFVKPMPMLLFLLPIVAYQEVTKALETITCELRRISQDIQDRKYDKALSTVKSGVTLRHHMLTELNAVGDVPIPLSYLKKLNEAFFNINGFFIPTTDAVVAQGRTNPIVAKVIDSLNQATENNPFDFNILGAYPFCNIFLAQQWQMHEGNLMAQLDIKRFLQKLDQSFLGAKRKNFVKNSFTQDHVRLAKKIKKVLLGNGHKSKYSKAPTYQAYENWFCIDMDSNIAPDLVWILPDPGFFQAIQGSMDVVTEEDLGGPSTSAYLSLVQSIYDCLDNDGLYIIISPDINVHSRDLHGIVDIKVNKARMNDVLSYRRLLEMAGFTIVDDDREKVKLIQSKFQDKDECFPICDSFYKIKDLPEVECLVHNAVIVGQKVVK